MAILPSDLLADQSDAPPLPPLLWRILARWWTPLLAWLTVRIERQLLARCTTHPLVRLAQVYDPTPVIRACAAFHHASGRGRPPTHPVSLLVRAELLRAWLGAISDRDLERRLASDLLYRWFVGLPLGATTPDHTTLARFHTWITTHQPQALFDHVLATLDQYDPEDPAVQIADTFALQSPATAVSPRVLLAQLSGALARDWIARAPASLQAAVPPLDLGPLLQPARHGTTAQRAAALHAAASTAAALLTALTPLLDPLPAPLRERFTDQLATLQHVLTSECHCVDGTWTRLPSGQRGTFRPASAHDPEATFRVHSPAPSTFGYNAALSTTTTRIRAVHAMTGSTPDAAALVPLLEQQQQRGDPLPAHLVMDQAAGHGKTRAQVAAATDGQTQVVAWIPPAGGRDLRRFGPTDFRVNAAEDACICPADVVSRRRYPAGVGDGMYFRFTAKDCAGCPLWAQCRDPERGPKTHRNVFISAYHSTLRVAAVFNRSATGQALLGERWRVEPVVAWLVRYAGARRARRVGLAAAQGQLLAACAVVNLRRWLGRIARGQAALPPPVRGGVRPLAG